MWGAVCRHKCARFYYYYIFFLLFYYYYLYCNKNKLSVVTRTRCNDNIIKRTKMPRILIIYYTVSYHVPILRLHINIVQCYYICTNYNNCRQDTIAHIIAKHAQSKLDRIRQAIDIIVFYGF